MTKTDIKMCVDVSCGGHYTLYIYIKEAGSPVFSEGASCNYNYEYKGVKLAANEGLECPLAFSGVWG